MTASPTKPEAAMSQRPSERITEEVTSWPGVSAGPGSRGEFAFTVGRRQIGHLHRDRSAHVSLPKHQWRELRDQGRITEHRVFPGKEGPVPRRIEGDQDVRDVLAVIRLK